jgi:hypothetical protein
MYSNAIALVSFASSIGRTKKTNPSGNIVEGISTRTKKIGLPSVIEKKKPISHTTTTITGP